MRVLIRIVFVLASLVLLPATVFAQATLAGVVKDSSGAVLPGVTVEASSPVLIERTRSATTDGTGQYQVADLRPGTYSLTFTLSGFATAKRENIVVSGSGVITINADLRVGNVSETVNVAGETPVVDVQSTRNQSVLDADVVKELPAARGYANILASVPSLTGAQASSSAATFVGFFSTHGGPANEGNVQIDGLGVGAAFNGGGVSGNAYDTANAQELQITLSGALGEAETGGPVLNIVPKTGGNTFKGQVFGTGAGSWAQANNIDDELKAQGVSAAGLVKLWDYSFALGGPIVKDKLWFFANYRDEGQSATVPGGFANLYEGDPSHWDWAANPAIEMRTPTSKTIGSGRLTAQVTPRNKVSFYYDYQKDCEGSSMNTTDGCRVRGSDWVGSNAFGAAFQSPEAQSNWWDGREVVSEATWTSPVTNKLLLEAGYSTFLSHWGWMKQPGALTNLVQVTHFAPEFKTYRGEDNIIDNTQAPQRWRASATYVTGAHNIKFGYQGGYFIEDTTDEGNDFGYTITDFGGGAGLANMRIYPWLQSNRTRSHAVYAQDQWTIGRLTVQGALRYDHASSFFPSDHNGTPGSMWTGPISFPETQGVTGFNDISPRGGVAWDVRGNGKTSLRVFLGKYLQSANNQENYTISNPALDGRNGRRGPNFQTAVSRFFLDFNGNHTPDCNLLLNAPNGECILPDLGGFGSTTSLTTVDPDVLHGMGVRPWDLQFGATVQQEILPRTSLEVGYHRRSFHNFFVYDNLNIGPSDFTLSSVVAPTDLKLGDHSGETIQYYIPNASINTANVRNFYTSADAYGDWSNYWQGFDITLNARLRNSLVAQFGTSTGRAITDNCGVVSRLPEQLNPALTNPGIQGQVFLGDLYQRASDCHKVEIWQTQARGFITYTVPKIDVLLSTILRFQPNSMFGFGATPEGNSTGLSAQYGTTVNGRTVAGVNLLPQGQVYADRINNVDLRFGKLLHFGRTRTSVALDLINLFNANTGTNFTLVYGPSYLVPTQILNARVAKFNVTVDF